MSAQHRAAEPARTSALPRRGTRSAPRAGAHHAKSAADGLEVDVAAGKDDAHALVAHVDGPLQHAGGGERAGGLDHELHALPEEAHRLDELRVGDRDDVVHVLAARAGR